VHVAAAARRLRFFSEEKTMDRQSNIANRYRAVITALKVSTAATAVACLAAALSPALADPLGGDGGTPAFAPGMIAHMQAMGRFKDPDQTVQSAPDIIPRFELDPDPSGAVATFQPGGATIPANNAFFQNLGANGRTCFTCHQPQTGWTVSAASVADRFAASHGTDPIFRLVDGATCPSDDVSSLGAKRRAYALLIEKGHPHRPADAKPHPIRRDGGRRSLWLQQESVDRPYQPDDRHRLGLSPAAARDQSRLPQRDHVGWPRGEPVQPG